MYCYKTACAGTGALISHKPYLVFGDDNPLKEVNVKDKSLLDKVRILEELPEEEKNAVLKVLELAISKKKFKEFMEQQLS